MGGVQQYLVHPGQDIGRGLLRMILKDLKDIEMTQDKLEDKLEKYM